MSPEQADGQPLDHRSDLFSLGSVLYFMATGHPPFRADRPMAVLKRTCHDPHRPAWQCNAEIPDALSEIIDRLLEKKPASRFAGAADLGRVLAGVLSEVQQGRIGRRARLRGGRRHWVTVFGVVSVVSFVFGIGAILSRPPSNGRESSTIESPPSREAANAAKEPSSPVTDLTAADLSPPHAAQRELNALFEALDVLETVSFPEDQFKPLDDHDRKE
jgi:serine/threonine-protein kinase